MKGEIAISTNSSIKISLTAQKKGYGCCVAIMNEGKFGGGEMLSLGFQTQWYSGSFLNYILLIAHPPLNHFLTCSYSKHADKGFKIEDITFRKFSYFQTTV